MITPTTTRETETASAIFTARGHLNFNLMAQDAKYPAKLALRKWLSANGVRSSYAATLSFAQLEAAWNDFSNAALDTLREGNTASATGLSAVSAALADEPNPFANAPFIDEEPLTMTATNTASNEIEAAAKLFAEALMNGNKAAPINEERVRAIVEEALSGVAPRAIVVHGPTDTVKLDERTNPVFDRVLKLVAKGANVLIVGPAGCGKTHLAQQVAKALNRRFGMISGSAGASESQLMGWLLPTDGGKFEYRPSDFVECYEEGNSVFLLDEFDGFDGNMLMCINSPLAGGPLFVPQRAGNPHVKRGENVSIICTANTYGTGADPIYSGRNQLDGATLDRFIVVEMTYAHALETDMAKAAGLKADQIERFHTLRSKVENAGLLRVISTRALSKVIVNMQCDMEFGAALQDLTTGWAADERQRVGF